jgi:hypothetical protein
MSRSEGGGEKQGQRKRSLGPRARRRAETTPVDSFRAVFSACGLPYGRCAGSKRAYVRRNPGVFFLANACVVVREGLAVWSGDLDLSSEHDVRALADAGRKLRRVLFVLREQAAARVPAGRWLVENAVVRIWQGRVSTTGTVRRMYGSLGEVVARYRDRDRGRL